MTIEIKSSDAIQKILAFIAARAKGQFLIDEELMEGVYDALRQFAAENRVRVTVVTPDAAKLQFCVCVGATAGGLAGLLSIGGGYGVLAGAAIGGLAGMTVAHFDLTFVRREDEGGYVFDLR
ncbi:hypothetical protein GCM10007421_16850 [Halopseudomonas oceani]|uniref:Uncharacterized protein n=1 Tax=Halopseudomonas oceani TaxID=1708783 RepID=A0A2P4ESK6_9GAMM|nr:hypothetical protein [Halopseudomonas oceani]POB02044.1 hypothetical protein C1949_14445 [Halopseudomonas oceani]GGE43280.1 hypothetical protein GCM10007421_16850 [Halopseudomonas oceani]